MNLASQRLGHRRRPVHLTIQIRPESIRRAFLICGILSSLLYVAMDVIGAAASPGYSFTSRAVSELSAIDSPARPFMLGLGLVYNILVIAFSLGVWATSAHNRRLQLTGMLLMIFGVLGFAAPFTPMHMRGTDFTLTDTLHITGAMIAVLLMFLSIAIGATALGRKFCLYSVLTIIALLLFGALTIPDAPRIAANQPTPWVGLYERINIGVFMLWVIVLAIRLWRYPDEVRNENA